MKYPPEKLDLTSADIKILWMLSNNPHCRWKDFIEEPIKIPNATLSKYLKRLNKDQGFIEKSLGDNGPIYKITSKGERELKNKLPYQTDFETILQMELDKNLNLINKFSEFFEFNKISDIEVQLEFIKLVSIINPDKLRDYSEELQYILLLFIVLNHPKFYPKYNLDVKSFINKYSLTPLGKLTNHQIGFFLEKVIDNDIYEVNFQKLEVKSITNDFYYSEKSYYGSVFQNTIDEHLKNLFLISRLTGRKLGNDDLIKTYGEITYDLVEKTKLFHPDLKNSLYDLIEKYRKNIKDQMIKEPKRERIEDYSSIISLPEVPRLDRSKIKERQSLKNKFFPKDGETEDNLIIYNTFGASMKQLSFVSKEKLSQNAWDLYEQKKYSPALENIDKLLEIEESADLYYWKAEILSLKLKDFKKALQAIEKGILINPMPRGFNFYRLKAQVLSESMRYEKALEAIEKAIDLDSQQELIGTKVEILLKLERFSEIKDIETTIPISIKKSLSRNMMRDLFEHRKNDEMLMKVLDLVILLVPEYITAHFERALLFKRLKLFEEAIVEINISIKIAKENDFYGNPNYYRTPQFSIVRAYEFKGIILRELGDEEGALKYYYMAKNVVDLTNPIALDVGEVLEGIMPNDEILKEYDNLILEYTKDFNSTDTDFYWNKANFLKKIKRFNEAGDLFEKMNNLEKEGKESFGPGYLFEWFEMLLDNKEYQKAIQVMNNDQYGLLKFEIGQFAEAGAFSIFLELLYNSELTFPMLPELYVDSVINAFTIGNSKIAKEIIDYGIQDEEEFIFKEFKNELKKEFFRRIKDEIQQENYKIVLKMLKNYHDYDNNEPEVFRYQAIVYLRQNDTIKALENIKKAISLDLDNPNYYQIKAIILYDLHKLWDALEAVNKAIELEPSNSENYRLKADILRDRNKPHQAYEALLKARDLTKTPDLYSRQMSEILERLGRNNEALVEIERAIESNPNGYWVYYKKAYILNKLGNFDKALENIDKALEYEPEDFVLIQDKLTILQNMNRIDEAIELLTTKKSVLSSGDSFEQFKAQILRDKAYNLMESGESDNSIKIIKEAIDLQPDWPEFYLSYGVILMHFGEYKNALEQLEIAKSLPFTPNETYIKIGKCLYELEQYEEALKSLNKGINLAKLSVKSVLLNEEDKPITMDFPESGLIEEAEKYISDVEKKLKENS